MSAFEVRSLMKVVNSLIKHEILTEILDFPIKLIGKINEHRFLIPPVHPVKAIDKYTLQLCLNKLQVSNQIQASLSLAHTLTKAGFANALSYLDLV